MTQVIEPPVVAKYNEARVKAEINRVLDTLAEQREPWLPQWITHHICDKHRAGLALDGPPDDVAFWDFGGYNTVRKATTDCINRRADPPLDDEAPEPQLRLPGFEREHLQDYYVVRRDGVDIGVCVLDCTDEELTAKVALYRGHAAKALAHADEIERFIDWRQANVQP